MPNPTTTPPPTIDPIPTPTDAPRAADSTPPTGDAAEPAAEPRLLRIQEVAAEVGATTRAIRYYEEIGLLQPAARSEGDYRLYDQSDLERIRHIRELRDSAGFSLAEIGQLLEDEDVRATNRAAYHATEDPSQRAEILSDSLARVERAIAILRSKSERLNAMITESEARRDRLRGKVEAMTRQATGEPETGR